MLKFYDIDQNYVKFLKGIDSKIPDIYYNGNNKFICGIVLSINNIDFYAPISHTTKKFRTNMIILDKNRPVGSIRFSFMFPALPNVLTIKDFAKIAKVDPKYASLLHTEYQFCLRNSIKISEKAFQVYKIGCNKNHKFNYTCCDFKKLEQHYMSYGR